MVAASLTIKNTMDAAYKKTELGQLPADWTIAILPSISKRITVGIATSATHAYRDSGIPMFRNQDIKSSGLRVDDLLYLNSLYEAGFKTKRLLPNDLLIARTGYPGTTALVPVEFKGAQSFTTLIVTPDHDAVSAPYLCAYLNSPMGRRFFDSSKIGGGQKNIGVKILYSCPVPMPSSLNEQKAIAQVLSDTDAQTETLEKLIEKKHRIKHGVVQELMTGRKRLPGFDGAWINRKIGEFSACTAGGTPSTLIPQYWDGSIPWMNSGELHLKRVRNVEGRITEEGLRNSAAKLLPENCILIGLAGQGKTRGTVATNLVPLCTNQSIAAIYTSSEILHNFLYHNLDSRYEELRELSAGDGGRGGLNLRLIQSIDIALPSKAEQKAIADIFDDLDAEIAGLENELRKAREVRQGMMQELLTGRVRLV